MKKIIAISGSTRKGSTNEMILKYVAEQYRDECDVLIYNEIDTLPHFNPDLDVIPEAVQKLHHLIALSDGVILCTPEYIFSLPGAMKNLIDWMVGVTVFSGKPTAYIVASALGEKTFESLSLIIKTLEAKVGVGSALLISGVRSKVGKDGMITHDETRRRVDALVKSLLHAMS